MTHLLWRTAARVCSLGGSHPYGTLLRDTNHIIFLSESHRAELGAKYGALGEKSSLIPAPPIMTLRTLCAEDAGRVRARGRALLGLGPDELLFAFFGYVYRDKGIETLLRAFQRAARSLPQVRLVIIGGYSRDSYNRAGTVSNRRYWDEMQSLCRELAVDNRVIWTGECKPEDDRASLYLRTADVCVLPFSSGLHVNNSSFAAVAAPWFAGHRHSGRQYRGSVRGRGKRLILPSGRTQSSGSGAGVVGAGHLPETPPPLRH